VLSSARRLDANASGMSNYESRDEARGVGREARL